MNVHVLGAPHLAVSDPIGLGWGPRICISNGILSAAAAAVAGPSHQVGAWVELGFSPLLVTYLMHESWSWPEASMLQHA